jgi:hypothetical protein
MLRLHLRIAAVTALSLPIFALGSTGPAFAQDKFKLGMAVGGEAASNWQKAQGDVARALAEQRGWDYV